jgi:hypothetical protein
VPGERNGEETNVEEDRFDQLKKPAVVHCATWAQAVGPGVKPLSTDDLCNLLLSALELVLT